MALQQSVTRTEDGASLDAFTVGDVLAAGFPTLADTTRAIAAFRADESADDWRLMGRPEWDRRAGMEFAGAGLLERAQWRVEVGPGVVGVYGSRPVLRENSAEREHDTRARTVGLLTRQQLLQGPAHWDCVHDSCQEVRAARRARLVHQGPVCAGGCDHGSCARVRGHRRSRITAFSAKSRARMVRTYASLDMRPVVGAAVAVDVTLTLPGDWLTVAPTAAASAKLVARFRERFFRTYGERACGVWKREFQDRARAARLRGQVYDREDSGKAPHWHFTIALPAGMRLGGVGAGPVCEGVCSHLSCARIRGFRCWLSLAWAAAVDHPDAEERAKHERAGTNVKVTDQARLRDPKRFGVYFSKHGLYSDKDYQNEPPPEWGGAVGRYWGHWNLDRAVAAVRVSATDALWVARTLRRHQHAQRYYVKATVWRKVGTVDRETGEIGFKWRKRKTTVTPKRMPSHRGYAVVNSGPRFAEQVARFLALDGLPALRYLP